MPSNHDPERRGERDAGEEEMLPVYEEHVDQDLTEPDEAEEHNARVIDLQTALSKANMMPHSRAMRQLGVGGLGGSGEQMARHYGLESQPVAGGNSFSQIPLSSSKRPKNPIGFADEAYFKETDNRIRPIPVSQPAHKQIQKIAKASHHRAGKSGSVQQLLMIPLS